MVTPFLGAPGGQAAEKRPWAAFGVGGALVVLVVGGIWFFTRSPGGAAGSGAPHPYAAQIKLGDIKMATAQNFVGASVTYLEGKVTNAGDKTVTHAVVNLTFKNSLGQVVQQEQLPLRVLEERPGYTDAVDLAMLPLAPGQARPFRLTLEHVSSDWNREYPEVKITDVATK